MPIPLFNYSVIIIFFVMLDKPMIDLYMLPSNDVIDLFTHIQLLIVENIKLVLFCLKFYIYSSV